MTRAEGEMVAIEDVLAGLGARLVTDPKGGAVTVQRGSHELVLHHKKSLASVDGDLKLLPAPAALRGGALARAPSTAWRAARAASRSGPSSGGRRRACWSSARSSIPKVTVSTFVSGELARVVFEASESVPFRVQQEPGRVTVAVPRDLVDVVLQPGAARGRHRRARSSSWAARENVFAVSSARASRS